MISDCQADKVPEPQFGEYSSGISVTFRFREPIGVSEAITLNSSFRLNSRQEAILNILNTYDGLTVQQIINILPSPPSQRMLQKDLKNLKEQDMIRMKGSARGSVWLLKPKK